MAKRERVEFLYDAKKSARARKLSDSRIFTNQENRSVARSSCEESKGSRIREDLYGSMERRQSVTRAYVCVWQKRIEGKEEKKENFLGTRYTLHRRLPNLTEYFLMHRSHVYRIERRKASSLFLSLSLYLSISLYSFSIYLFFSVCPSPEIDNCMLVR